MAAVDVPTKLLSPLARALAADGYQLAVSVTGDHTVLIEVQAGPDAAADCLLPRQLFVDIARQRLVHVDGRPWTATVVYPST